MNTRELRDEIIKKVVGIKLGTRKRLMLFSRGFKNVCVCFEQLGDFKYYNTSLSVRNNITLLVHSVLTRVNGLNIYERHTR